jgi:hypothetical protein
MSLLDASRHICKAKKKSLKNPNEIKKTMQLPLLGDVLEWLLPREIIGDSFSSIILVLSVIR